MPATRGPGRRQRSLAPLSREPRTRPVKDPAVIRASAPPQSGAGTELAGTVQDRNVAVLARVRARRWP
jgi:hypothetical protein